MPERDTKSAAKLLRSCLDVEPAPAGTLAALVVSFSASTCSYCRMPAFPHEETHEHQAAYGQGPWLGCGARFASITTPYRMDDDWRRALTEMRRDLPIVDYVNALKGEADA